MDCCNKLDDLDEMEVFLDKLKSSDGLWWWSAGNGGGDDNISTIDGFLDTDCPWRGCNWAWFMGDSGDLRNDGLWDIGGKDWGNWGERLGNLGEISIGTRVGSVLLRFRWNLASNGWNKWEKTSRFPNRCEYHSFQ